MDYPGGFAGSGLANPNALEMYPNGVPSMGGGSPLAGIMAKYGGGGFSAPGPTAYMGRNYPNMPISGPMPVGGTPSATPFGPVDPGINMPNMPFSSSDIDPIRRNSKQAGAKGGGAKGGGRAMPGPSAIAQTRSF